MQNRQNLPNFLFRVLVQVEVTIFLIVVVIERVVELRHTIRFVGVESGELFVDTIEILVFRRLL